MTHSSPANAGWTPDQFWEYVGGLAGEFEAGQMRDMMVSQGLSLGIRAQCAPEPATNALAVWAREVAYAHNFYDPREADDLADALIRNTPVVASLQTPAPQMTDARELELLLAVEEAARKLPRTTPGAGGASTVHKYAIEAAIAWENDAALRALTKYRYDRAAFTSPKCGDGA